MKIYKKILYHILIPHDLIYKLHGWSTIKLHFDLDLIYHRDLFFIHVRKEIADNLIKMIIK